MPVSEKMSNSPRRTTRRSISKRRISKRKERSTTSPRKEDPEQKSIFSWIFSLSMCTSSSLANDVLEPSSGSLQRSSSKNLSFDEESPNKSSKSSNRQSFDSCKVKFSFDECEYASDCMERGSNADMYNFYPGRGDGPGVSPLKSILKRQSTSADEHDRDDVQSPPTNSAKHRSPEFIDSLGFRENPLANSTRGKVPQSVSMQPKMRYLVPDACLDEAVGAEPPLHRTASFERPPAAEHQRHLENSFQWKRNMEEEDFRLALSLAEEEINAVQQNALKSQLASSSSLSTLTRSSSWHQHQASYNIASSSFDLYSSPASEKVPSPRSRPMTIQSSSAKGPSFPSPQKFGAADASPKTPIVGPSGISSKSAPTASPRTPQMPIGVNLQLGDRPISARKLSPLRPSKGLDSQSPAPGNRGSINRRRIPTPMEAQEMLLEFAMRASLEEEERKAKFQQRLEIREKLALSKALVASVDANAFTM